MLLALRIYSRAPFLLALLFLILTYTVSYHWNHYFEVIGIFSALGFAIVNTGLILLLAILKIMNRNIPDLRKTIVLLILQFPFVSGVFFVCASMRLGFS